ncbi:hypothetical protein [Sphingomonas solaris]|uniref:Uncharacterized protein n=1 Tax=Alterirhizorhabdus solaris TaxID=2529389 RepID=A0A558R858_9SPHN|nr:hypothetical protein [Sphingomonas solaris]TVV75570.1 hypothetical protein FOY91_06835 [Sphingomonas solaris]
MTAPIASFADLVQVEREGRDLGEFLADFVDARLTYHRLICGQPGSDWRVGQPQAQCCTRSDCPMVRKDAA